jgi:hypothetical protein
MARDAGTGTGSGVSHDGGEDGAGLGPSPYLGTASAVPGTIQAVNFDLGGPGVAYQHTPYSGEPAPVPYRTDHAAVYVGTCVSGSSSCGYRVGYVNVADWLGYTVNVAATGTYTLAALVANPNSASNTMLVDVDSTTVTGHVTLPQTSSYEDWADATMSISLTAGRHFVKVVAETGDNDWDTFTFTRAGTTSDAGMEAGRDAAPEASNDSTTPTSSFGTGTSYSPIYMCASGGTCTGTAVTGGGTMPSTSGAPNADSCTTAVAGSGVCTCLNALTSVTTTTPLVIHSGTYSWTGCTLIVNRSLIGTDTGSGLPILSRTDFDPSTDGALMAVPQNSSARWIYGLELILPNPCYGLGLDCPSPGPGMDGVEYSTLIALGSVNGLTIANNLIQGGGNGVNDMWIDHTESGSPSTPGARNVLIDGNTFQQQHRTCIDSTVSSNGWAAVNNSFTYTDGYVGPVDLEPYGDTFGTDVILNHEYSYNIFTDPTPAYNGTGGNPCTGTGNCYVAGMISTGGTDGATGSNVYASHNYGSWSPSVTFLYNTEFNNVHDEGNNIPGSTVPP